MECDLHLMSAGVQEFRSRGNPLWLPQVCPGFLMVWEIPLSRTNTLLRSNLGSHSPNGLSK